MLQKITLLLVGSFLSLIVLLQQDKQESLGNAFGGTYRTKAERVLTKLTYVSFVVLCAFLLYFNGTLFK